MTTIRNFWIAHRDRIARIIFWPYVISLGIFMIYSFYTHCQTFGSGLDSLPQALFWVFTLMGGLITPVIAIRSWVVVFHDDADALSVVLASSIWGGGIIGDYEGVWFGGFAVLLCLILLNWFFPGVLMFLLQGVVSVAMLIVALVHLPMLVIGYGIHLRDLCTKNS